MYKNDTSAVIVKGARYMPCTLTDEENGREYKINIKEPKLKVYKQFEALDDSSDISDITAVTAAVLNGNKEGIKIDADFVENNFTLDEIAKFFDDFSNWIKTARETNPN